MSTTRSAYDARRPELRIGQYRLLSQVGEGGMGVVHLAQTPAGEHVALKVLRPHVIGDGEARERLAREVASLRRVRSPRIAEVIDADPWGETPYVVTRYVPGLSLHEHTRRMGVLAGDDLRRFASGLAEAVVAVHAAGVLHRDIKPSNVLLERGLPVLIDFGLARLADDPRMTVTGWLLGTPGYLAPEILHGDEATTASDVHSWAATVVFAATGRPPFGRGPAMAVMDRVRRGEHDLSGVPAALRPTLLAALAPDPRDRPSLPALLADLAPPTDGAVHDGPVPLTEPPTARLPAPRTAPARPTYPASRRLTSRLQRGGLVAGLLATVAVGVAAAPYLAVAAAAVAALLLRTWSWTAQARRERVHRRGRRCWYDGPLTAMTVPWYLLVAAGGTIMLVAWAALVALATGFGSFVLRLPADTALLLTGAALSLSLWSGPGSRRVRGPVRGLAVAATRHPWLGWGAVALVGCALLGTSLVLNEGGTVWTPQPGPPWRDGTLLGGLLRFF